MIKIRKIKGSNINLSVEAGARLMNVQVASSMKGRRAWCVGARGGGDYFIICLNQLDCFVLCDFVLFLVFDEFFVEF